jgi:methylenetetrahydrofolate dehydrogenase (NADP+) / methenyltetrahydrofolate cyclohydrolase
MLRVPCYVKIIDGKKIADRIKDEIVAEILARNGGNLHADQRPNLAIILVGDRPDSELYVSLKEKEAKKVGVDTSLYKFSADASEQELEETINFLNSDENVDGILLQLPLPEKFNTDKIVSLIAPEKDIERFHPENLKKLGEDGVLPPLCQVVLEVAEEANFDLAGKSACVIANSDVLGDSLAKILEKEGALAKVVSSEDDDWQEAAVKADILISAVGQPRLIKADCVKKDALLIDIGITKEGKKVFGDADAESVKNKAGFLTPVPGGVGPITIAAALANTVEIWKRKNNF